MLSVVPDIHADPQRLEKTLAAIGPHEQIAFLGDLIDAGRTVKSASDRKVLAAVRSLIDSGRAVGILGNHELNAILFHRIGEAGPLREHNKKNKLQHGSFIDSFGIATSEAIEWTDWLLRTFPLWRDIHGLRLIHAYWGQEQIELIKKRRPNGFLEEADLNEIAAEESDFAKAVKLILSGPERRLPPDFHITDNYGHTRKDIRFAWWKEGRVLWRDAALSVQNLGELPDGFLPEELRVPYANGEMPILFGHYKIEGHPRLLSETIACLDFPARPCIYRWNGESKLSVNSLIAV